MNKAQSNKHPVADGRREKATSLPPPAKASGNKPNILNYLQINANQPQNRRPACAAKASENEQASQQTTGGTCNVAVRQVGTKRRMSSPCNLL